MATYGKECRPTEGRRRSSYFVDGGDGAKVPSSSQSFSSDCGGDDPETDEGSAPEKRKQFNIKPRDLIDPRRPWVLVEGGSLLGYFDWVPKHLRVGPWSPIAPLYLILLVFCTLYFKPSSDKYIDSVDGGTSDDTSRTGLPELYSVFWFYNALVFFLMLYVHSELVGAAGCFVYCTYTLQSWTMLTARHGLSALSPFLSHSHVLLRLNEVLRFPSLVTATVTFTIWNFILMPLIALLSMKTPRERKKFLRWCFSFRMSQIHVFNIIYAMINAVACCPPNDTFDEGDFHFAFSLAVLYGLFYVLILDRLGCHLYPIFSPRTPVFALTWTALFGCYCVSFMGWNWVIKDGRLRKWCTVFVQTAGGGMP